MSSDEKPDPCYICHDDPERKETCSRCGVERPERVAELPGEPWIIKMCGGPEWRVGYRIVQNGGETGKDVQWQLISPWRPTRTEAIEDWIETSRKLNGECPDECTHQELCLQLQQCQADYGEMRERAEQAEGYVKECCECKGEKLAKAQAEITGLRAELDTQAKDYNAALDRQRERYDALSLQLSETRAALAGGEG